MPPRLKRAQVVPPALLQQALFLEEGQSLTTEVPRESVELARQHWYRALDAERGREEFSISVERILRSPIARLIIRRISSDCICSSPSISPLVPRSIEAPLPTPVSGVEDVPQFYPTPLPMWRIAFVNWLEREGKEDVTREEFIAWHEGAVEMKKETEPFAVPPSLDDALSQIFPPFEVRYEEDEIRDGKRNPWDFATAPMKEGEENE